MILLFDDNDPQQLGKELASRTTVIIERLSPHVEHFSFVNSSDVKSLVERSIIVCVHDSFLPQDTKAHIIAVSNQLKKPLVIFSGGASFTTIQFSDKENQILKIKKDRFYFNLTPFVSRLNPTKKIDLKSLAYGSNYELTRTNLLVERLCYKALEDAENFSFLEFTSTHGDNIQNYKDILELFSFLYSNEDEASSEFAFSEEKFKNMNSMQFYTFLIEIKKNIKEIYE